MAEKPATIDAYLARVPQEQRAALQHLREVIRSVAPDAQELISYQIPTFKQDGMLVAFAAAKSHCALYALHPALIEAHAEALKDFSTSTGTIRFTPERPIPDDLVRRLVTERLAENAAAAAARKARKTRKA